MIAIAAGYNQEVVFLFHRLLLAAMQYNNYALLKTLFARPDDWITVLVI